MDESCTYLFVPDGAGGCRPASFSEWAVWREAVDYDTPFREGGLRIADDEPLPGVRVSTVFLGTNHRFVGSGAPILFESMTFGGPLDGEQARYATAAEAAQGHARMMAAVIAAGE